MNEAIAGFEVVLHENLITEKYFTLIESKVEYLTNQLGSLSKKLSSKPEAGSWWLRQWRTS